MRNRLMAILAMATLATPARAEEPAKFARCGGWNCSVTVVEVKAADTDKAWALGRTTQADAEEDCSGREGADRTACVVELMAQPPIVISANCPLGTASRNGGETYRLSKAALAGRLPHADDPKFWAGSLTGRARYTLISWIQVLCPDTSRRLNILRKSDRPGPDEPPGHSRSDPGPYARIVSDFTLWLCEAPHDRHQKQRLAAAIREATHASEGACTREEAMKSDVQRQTEYQKRRKQTETRVTIWVEKDVAATIDRCRGDESRTAFINRAIAARLHDSPGPAPATSSGTAMTADTDTSARPEDSVIYRGLQLWPPADTTAPDGPPDPGKPDVDAAFWLTASLHRTLLAYGASPATAARRTRNWARHIARIVHPSAVARLMREMSDRLETTTRPPERDRVTASRAPRRPIGP